MVKAANATPALFMNVRLPDLFMIKLVWLKNKQKEEVLKVISIFLHEKNQDGLLFVFFAQRFIK